MMAATAFRLRSSLTCLFLLSLSSSDAFTPWTYICDKEFCIKSSEYLPGDPRGSSLAECKLTCGKYAQLWPRPKTCELGKEVVDFDIEKITITFENEAGAASKQWVKEIVDKRIAWLREEARGEAKSSENEDERSLEIKVSWTDSEDPPKIKISSNEDYSLQIQNRVVTIQAETFFGIRHGLETLFQLVGFDDINSIFILNKQAQIEDGPQFRHRGVLLDSSRNFIPMSVIQNVISGMSFNKLNVLHWHLTDTQSFPVQLERFPNTTGKMAQFGAYAKEKVYSVKEMKELVEFANKQGVRIIPEFDAPAHVGYGWQFPGAEDFTVCLGKEPWQDFCVQPPCGQLNPYKEDMYSILEELYLEYFEIFNFDSFHYGGDEVDFRCWGSEEAVTKPMIEEGLSLDDAGYVEIWSRFQSRVRGLIQQVSGSGIDEHILWTSSLTHKEFIETALPEDYTIQIWTEATDSQIGVLLGTSHNLLISNYDALYMDCGFSAWVGDGNNWCSPYKSWQTVYENDLYEIILSHGASEADKKRVTGGEVALWTENVSGKSFEMKLFPRATAHAERMWTNPSSSFVEAQKRLVDQTNRMINRGIGSDGVQPEYCRLNEGRCYLKEEEDKPSDGNSHNLCYFAKYFLIMLFIVMS